MNVCFFFDHSISENTLTFPGIFDVAALYCCWTLIRSLHVVNDKQNRGNGPGEKRRNRLSQDSKHTLRIYENSKYHGWSNKTSHIEASLWRLREDKERHTSSQVPWQPHRIPLADCRTTRASQDARPPTMRLQPSLTLRRKLFNGWQPCTWCIVRKQRYGRGCAGKFKPFSKPDRSSGQDRSKNQRTKNQTEKFYNVSSLIHPLQTRTFGKMYQSFGLLDQNTRKSYNHLNNCRDMTKIPVVMRNL